MIKFILFTALVCLVATRATNAAPLPLAAMEIPMAALDMSTSTLAGSVDFRGEGGNLTLAGMDLANDSQLALEISAWVQAYQSLESQLRALVAENAGNLLQRLKFADFVQ
jgi:hypothetical protein